MVFYIERAKYQIIDNIIHFKSRFIFVTRKSDIEAK